MGFKNPFRRKRIPHPDQPPNDVHYTLGETFNSGANNLVYSTPYPHPLEDRFGGIVPLRSFGFAPSVVYQNLALPVQPILAGIPAGSYYTDPLTGPVQQ